VGLDKLRKIMRKLLLIALSIAMISSCKKEEEQYQQINLKREYKLNGKSLTLTYNINKEGRVAVIEKTADNLSIYKHFKDNPNMFVNYNIETGKGELYEDLEDFKNSLEPLTPKQIEQVNQLKSAKLGINFYAYHHPNYNSLAWSTGINHMSAYSGWENTEISVNYINFANWLSSADRKGFAKATLGSANNSVSSIQILQNTSSTSHPANLFQVMIYEKTTFGFTGFQLQKNSKVTGFFTNGTSPQNGCDDLRKWTMSSFLWWTTVTWNDDVESISGFYRN
jgi:hypothetical protein